LGAEFAELNGFDSGREAAVFIIRNFSASSEF
jgi:hypothetical protein